MDQIESILQSVSNTLIPINGIAGVVLGGSRAREPIRWNPTLILASIIIAIPLI